MLFVVAASLALFAEATAGDVKGALTYEGKVRESPVGPGGSLLAVLLRHDGPNVRLLGTLSVGDMELRRLAGTTVRVHGLDGGSTGLEVERYEILDIGNGVVPRVGTLAALGKEEQLIFVDASGAAESLAPGWSKKLKQHIGAKVWIVGKTTGTYFTPRQFSILRSPPRPERSP